MPPFPQAHMLTPNHMTALDHLALIAQATSDRIVSLEYFGIQLQKDLAENDQKLLDLRTTRADLLAAIAILTPDVQPTSLGTFHVEPAYTNTSSYAPNDPPSA